MKLIGVTQHRFLILFCLVLNASCTQSVVGGFTSAVEKPSALTIAAGEPIEYMTYDATTSVPTNLTPFAHAGSGTIGAPIAAQTYGTGVVMPAGLTLQTSVPQITDDLWRIDDLTSSRYVSVSVTAAQPLSPLQTCSATGPVGALTCSMISGFGILTSLITQSGNLQVTGALEGQQTLSNILPVRRHVYESVSNIQPGAPDTFRSELLATSNYLFFIYEFPGTNFRKLFQFDGTEVRQAAQLTGGSDNITRMTVYKDHLYFWSNFGFGYYLYRATGTSIERVFANQGSGSELAIMNDELYFCGYPNSGSAQLFKTDGTSVTAVTQLNTTGIFTGIVASQNAVFFVATVGTDQIVFRYNSSGVKAITGTNNAGIYTFGHSTLPNDTRMHATSTHLYFEGYDEVESLDYTFRTDGDTITRTAGTYLGDFEDRNEVGDSLYVRYNISKLYRIGPTGAFDLGIDLQFGSSSKAVLNGALYVEGSPAGGSSLKKLLVTSDGVNFKRLTNLAPGANDNLRGVHVLGNHIYASSNSNKVLRSDGGASASLIINAFPTNNLSSAAIFKGEFHDLAYNGVGTKLFRLREIK